MVHGVCVEGIKRHHQAAAHDGRLRQHGARRVRCPPSQTRPAHDLTLPFLLAYSMAPRWWATATPRLPPPLLEQGQGGLDGAMRKGPAGPGGPGMGSAGADAGRAAVPGRSRATDGDGGPARRGRHGADGARCATTTDMLLVPVPVVPVAAGARPHARAAGGKGVRPAGSASSSRGHGVARVRRRWRSRKGHNGARTMGTGCPARMMAACSLLGWACMRFGRHRPPAGMGRLGGGWMMPDAPPRGHGTLGGRMDGAGCASHVAGPRRRHWPGAARYAGRQGPRTWRHRPRTWGQPVCKPLVTGGGQACKHGRGDGVIHGRQMRGRR